MLYFDIFDHPLTKVEIVKLAAGNSSETRAADSLNELVQAKMLYEIDGYYSVQPNYKGLISRREAGERNAALQRAKAYKRAKFIGRFPYVKAAYISGSMSKGVMHEDGDIDFFIITEPGRLWVARTFLVLFKKTFLFNSRKFFCLNYFIDSSKLEIEEKNMFTATEMVTLKPIYDSGIYNQFREANNWVEGFIPNSKKEEVIYNGKTSRPIANLIEAMLNNSFGDKLDEWFMTGTLKVWKRKFKHMENVDFDIALKTRKYVSKHHPRNFQSRVLVALDERFLSFEEKHNTKLS